MFQVDNSDLVAQAQALVAGESNRVANLANLSALLMQGIDNLNWAGFYLLDEHSDSANELVLGPFQGGPACIRIPFNKGVCGAAATTQQTQRVADVHAFAGHIACDANTNSELVVPVVVNEQTVAVIDLDSPKFDNFDERLQQVLEHIAQLIAELWQEWH